MTGPSDRETESPMLVPSPLDIRYPNANLPARVSLVQGPTPIRPLTNLTKRLQGPDIWIKDNGQSSPLYGGNKPRKLEYILAGAMAMGFQRVVTIGGIGSNHCLATAIHAHKFGLNCSLILGPQDMREKDRRNLLADWYYGADIHLMERYDQAGEIIRSINYQYTEKEGKEPYLIPGGGSGPLGSLGVVNGFLEFAQQVAEGATPCPERIYIPVGTCGTVAGLIIGARLTGMLTKIVGVQVTPDPVSSIEKIIDLANSTLALMRRHGVEEAAQIQIDEHDFSLLDGYLGDGYSQPTEKGKKAVELMTEEENIALEYTYTGKTVAALIDDATVKGRKGPLLYWHTFNSVDFWTPIKDKINPDQAPERLKKFL